jgi:hypothetical protein
VRVLTFGLSRWRASFLSVFLSWVSKTQPNNPLHRYEFGPPKFFSKTFKFSIMFYSNWQISGGEPRSGPMSKSPFALSVPFHTTLGHNIPRVLFPRLRPLGGTPPLNHGRAAAKPTIGARQRRLCLPSPLSLPVTCSAKEPASNTHHTLTCITLPCHFPSAHTLQHITFLKVYWP